MTWKNKYLWIFGFLVSLTTVSINFGTNFNINNNDFSPLATYKDLLSGKSLMPIDIDSIVLLVIVLAILLISLVLWIFGILSKGALIGLADKIDKKQIGNIREGFKIGKKYFWRIFGIDFVIGLIILVSLILLVTPIIFLFYYHMNGRAIGQSILAILIFVPEVFIFNFINKYGQRYIVMNDAKLFDAMGKAYDMLKSHLGSTILMILILGLTNIVAGMIILAAVAMLLIFIGIPLVLIGLLMNALLGIGAVIAVAIFGGLIFFALIFFLRSILTAFEYNAWTLTFKEFLKK